MKLCLRSRQTTTNHFTLSGFIFFCKFKFSGLLYTMHLVMLNWEYLLLMTSHHEGHYIFFYGKRCLQAVSFILLVVFFSDSF